MKLPFFPLKKPKNPGDFEIYYDKEWLERHSYFSDHRTRFIESWLFVEHLPWNGSCVIDIGGAGPISTYAHHVYNAQLLTTSHDLRFRSDIPDNTADIVLCTETIEHIKDVESSHISDLEAFNYSGVNNLLADIVRISKPNASIFITTPNSSSLISLTKWLAKQPLLMDSRHVREFTLEDLGDKCKKAGMKSEKIITKNTWSEYKGHQLETINKFVAGMGYGIDDRGDNILALFTNDKGRYQSQ